MARAKKETALTPEERLQAALVPDWEWPYKLPKNWCWTTVGTICDGFQYGYTEKATFEKIGPHFIRITDIGDGIINDSGAPYCKIDSDLFIKYKINKDDILIARMGSVGENGLATHNIDGVFASYLIRIVPRSNAKYVCNFLQTNLYWGQISEKAQGTTRLNVNANVLKNLIIPLPPLAEQQHIVDRIESLFAKLDEAKEKAQAVVDSFETRKAAILHKAFTGELTAKWREEHGSSIGHWKECSIGDVFTHTTGKALKRNNQNGILKKYITTSNLYWGTFDFSEVREMYFTNEELEKCTAKKGDLLVCNGGDVGRAAIWNYDYDICLQNHISKLRRKTDSISVPFFYYYFMFLKINGNIAGRGIGIASLSAKDLLAIKVYLPSMTEQQQISHILDELFDKEQQTKEAAEAVLDQIDLMKKSILARAFRGELGTNDPIEESALELLKRVLESK